MVCMYRHYRKYTYIHIISICIIVTGYMLLLTIIYICISGRRSAVGPSPRLHHNGMPHRWGPVQRGKTKERLAG